MNVRQALNRWLQGPRRTYGEGLALFRLLAPDSMKRRYLSYFESTDGQQDVRTSILVDKLSRIGRELRLNPQLSRDILESEFMEEPKPQNAPQPAKPASVTDTLTGIRITTSYDSLPDDMRKVFDEIREITPLYAKLHSHLSECTTDSERKETADELCRLDDRRRHLWDILDSWAKGAPVETFEKRPEYSSDSIVSGLQMAQRRKRLRDNIRYSRLVLGKARKSGDENAVRAAESRLAAYQQELDILERQIADAER